MKYWHKKILFLASSSIALASIVIIPAVLIEAGYFQSNKNVDFQNKLIKSLRGGDLVLFSEFLVSNDLYYEFACINGEYLSPSDVFAWQKNKMQITNLELRNIQNIGYENYWSISLFDKFGKGELISIYTPNMIISSEREFNMDSSCFKSEDLFFRQYRVGAEHKENTLDIIMN